MKKEFDIYNPPAGTFRYVQVRNTFNEIIEGFAFDATKGKELKDLYDTLRSEFDSRIMIWGYVDNYSLLPVGILATDPQIGDLVGVNTDQGSVILGTRRLKGFYKRTFSTGNREIDYGTVPYTGLPLSPSDVGAAAQSSEEVYDASIGDNATADVHLAAYSDYANNAGNASTVTTNADLTGQVTSVGNVTTVPNATVIGKLLTGFSAAVGTVAATDTILQAFNKIVANIALKAPIDNPTFTGVAKAPNFVEGFTTTATANGTTVLTIASTFLQYFTGILNQTITLATTSLIAGHQYLITNLSTGNLTVNASGGTAVIVIPANSSVMVTALVATPTTSAQWSYSYAGQASELIAGALLIANATEAALGINDAEAMTALKTLLYDRINYPMYEGSYADLNLGAFNFFNDRSMLNANGGQMVKLTNKTGSASVKGTLVNCSPTTDNAFSVETSEYDTIGVVFENGVADGSECWIVVSGIAEVLLVNSTASTRGYWVYADAVDGRANATVALPAGGTITALENHFKEIGHCLESKTAGTNVLCKIMLHFN